MQVVQANGVIAMKKGSTHCVYRGRHSGKGEIQSHVTKVVIAWQAWHSQACKVAGGVCMVVARQGWCGKKSTKLPR